MARSERMSDKPRESRHVDASLDGDEEWDNASSQDVTPRPSGMTVFSLRLPTDEFAFLKREADRRQTTMSDLCRTALRFYLMPRATGTLSSTAAQVVTVTPQWIGGLMGPALRAENIVTEGTARP